MAKKPAKKPTPVKPDRHIEMQLRHTFTQKETLEIAKKMAEASRELNQAEEEKKAVTSQLKAKVDGISARVTEHAGKINSGYEYRSTKVTVKYHTPKTGIKSLSRDDTGEHLETAEMSQSEMQDELKLDPAPGTLPNPVLKESDAGKVKAAPGTVRVAADEGSDDERQ
jgi:hypothetical protein